MMEKMAFIEYMVEMVEMVKLEQLLEMEIKRTDIRRVLLVVLDILAQLDIR